MQQRPIPNETARDGREPAVYHLPVGDGDEGAILSVDRMEVGRVMIARYMRMYMPKNADIVGVTSLCSV